jgi:hypothetical protein
MTSSLLLTEHMCVVADDPSHEPKHPPRKDDRSASYNIDETTWAWIPVLIITLFTVLMLMSVKSDRWFQGKSLRLWLMRYVSVETLYNTLNGADAHEWKEQHDIEIGHQVFMMLGTMLLVGNLVFNPNADKRYVMAVLTYLQIFCLVLNTVLDMLLIKVMGRVDVVRSVNTKLRFSHCIYQVILFCTDFIGGSLHLPVDCFVWATVHYSYEAVGLALEGLNVIGMSEFAIIAIVNAQIIGTEVASTGWTCAFGMSCLFMSVMSVIGGQVFKWRQALRHPIKPPLPSHHEGRHEVHVQGGAAAASKRSSGGHRLSSRGAATTQHSLEPTDDNSEELRSASSPDEDEALPTTTPMRASSDDNNNDDHREAAISEPLISAAGRITSA